MRNNPLRYIDPSGLFLTSVDAACVQNPVLCAAIFGSALGAAANHAATTCPVMHNEASRPPNLAPADANQDEALQTVKDAAGVGNNTDEPVVVPNTDPVTGEVIPDSEVLQYLDDQGNNVVEIRHDYDGHYFGEGDSQNRGPHYNYPNTGDGGHYDYTGPGVPHGQGTYYRPRR